MAASRQAARAERPAITCLFLDIGGVLLTDGWPHAARVRAARLFNLAWPDMERRHHAAFDAFEQGRLTLEEYLDAVVFHAKRPFTRARFRRFMLAQSTPHPEMIALVARLKAQHGVKVVVVSNEARELNAHRIRAFRLDCIADIFVSSCFVGLRKPDPAIFRLALDLAQVPAEQVIYVENTALFVEVAGRLGIRGVLHVDAASTRAALTALGLRVRQEITAPLWPAMHPAGRRCSSLT